jgi:hypothetical protein
MTIVTTGKDTWDEMLKDIIQLANENQTVMDGTIETVFAIMDDADIVWAVWQDATERHGVGHLLIKGHELLHRCIATQQDLTRVKWTGISCVEADQAAALEQVYTERMFGKAN